MYTSLPNFPRKKSVFVSVFRTDVARTRMASTRKNIWFWKITETLNARSPCFKRPSIRYLQRVTLVNNRNTQWCYVTKYWYRWLENHCLFKRLKKTRRRFSIRLHFIIIIIIIVFHDNFARFPPNSMIFFEMKGRTFSSVPILVNILDQISRYRDLPQRKIRIPNISTCAS